MSVPPDQVPIRKALSRLVSRGRNAIWLPDVQPLLELPTVRAHRAAHAEDPEHEAFESVRQVLSEATDKLGPSQYRELLTIVLGLDTGYENLGLGQRRELAGQRFRGGGAPVTGATIRQYHEPRALDQLTSVLVTDREAHPRLSREDIADVQEHINFEWHPYAHERWDGERLYFWLLAHSTYRYDDAISRVERAVQQTGVHAWAFYEIYGPYDILIRTWLPCQPNEFEHALIEAFAGDPGVMIQSFAVHDIVHNWPWHQPNSLQEPSSDSLARIPPAADLALASRAGTDVSRSFEESYIQNAVLMPIQESNGIGIFVVLAAIRPISHSDELAIGERIVKAAHECDLKEVSLYRGIGFGSYLLRGRVRADSFYEIGRKLAAAMRKATGEYGWRTYTYVCSTAAPMVYHDDIRGDQRSKQLEANRLLEQRENATFGVMGSATVALEHWLSTGELQNSPEATDALMRSVTSFLNSHGGSIVIGAVDADHAGSDDSPRLAKAPRVGDYIVCGIDLDRLADIDHYECFIRDHLQASITPDPLSYVNIEFDKVEGVTVCLLRIGPLDHSAASIPWFYHRPKRSRGTYEFLVRAGSSARSLAGPNLDAYKASATQRVAT